MSSLHRTQWNKQARSVSLVHFVIILSTVVAFLFLGTQAQANHKTGAADKDNQIFLPLVVNRWPLPPPSPLTIHDIDNYDNNGNYIVDWDEDPNKLSENYVLEESECTYWCDEFNSPTVVYSGTNTTWSTPLTGKSAGTYLYRVHGHNATGYGEFSETKTVTVVPDPTPLFSGVGAQLNTPPKISDFLLSEFQFTFHAGCISYWPEEFYNLKHGDCKDYATLSSYLLAQHGYRAKIVPYSWYGQDGTRYGHVVVIYQNTDGTLQYMSNGQIM